MTKVLLSILPSFESFNLLVPHLGIACMKAYIKKFKPDCLVNTVDLRIYKKNKEIWCPEDFPQITTRKIFASDIYELPLLASLIDKFKKKVNLNELIEPDYKTVFDWAVDRTILPEITFERLKKSHLFAVKHLPKFGGYDVIGFSLYVSNLYLSIFMALVIKMTYPKTKIVFGGPQVTQSNTTRELLLKAGIADFLILGEGEQPLLEIINALENNDNFENILGVKTLANFEKQDTFSQSAIVQELPIPNYDGTIFELYKNKVIPIYSNRGCTFRCHFCSEHSLFGKEFKRRSSEKVVADMNYLSEKYHIDAFYFCDSLLNASMEDNWLEEFTSLLEKNTKKFTWYGRFRAEMNEDLVSKLKKSGLVTAAMGVESFSQDTLDKMNKRKEEQNAIDTIRYLIKYGIKASINLFVGYSGEKESDFMSTFLVTNTLYEEFKKQGTLNLFKITVRNFELRPFSTTYLYPSKFGLDVETWESKFLDNYPQELENVFKKSPYSFKVKDVSLGETLHRIMMLNQIRYKEEYLQDAPRVSLNDGYEHF